MIKFINQVDSIGAMTFALLGCSSQLNLGVYATDKKTELSVLVDRATGAASIKDGQVELMLHRLVCFLTFLFSDTCFKIQIIIDIGMLSCSFFNNAKGVLSWTTVEESGNLSTKWCVSMTGVKG